MTKKETTRRPFELSEESTQLMIEKQQILETGCADKDLLNIRKKVTKSIRKDRRQHALRAVSKELDIRDQFMGLKWLRTPYGPVPLGMKDKDGKHVPFSKRAEKAAEFMGSTIWGGAAITPDVSTDSTCNTRIVTEDLGVSIEHISMNELFWAIKKLKRDKAPGPDG